MDKKKLRNLTTEEIIGQVMLAKSGLNDWMANIQPGSGNTPKITNVVMMGTVNT
jgi:adenine C2-methylase RlmN of 23S rRNA A2503 and tRNA A37